MARVEGRLFGLVGMVVRMADSILDVVILDVVAHFATTARLGSSPAGMSAAEQAAVAGVAP